jgi:2-polyprenyl-3-methyl-5-hydroxy-6-metoxy-1,4-benzoquinol methylase
MPDYPWYNTHLKGKTENYLLSANHHLQRYIFALLHSEKDTTCLDLGCGSGYGAFLMGLQCKNVLGVDKDPEAIEYARNHFNQGHVGFIEKDMLPIIHDYDIITCFEVIEHLTEAQGVYLLKSIMNHGKHFFISTPYDARLGERIYHKSQWEYADFMRIAGDEFNLQFYSQDYETGLIKKGLNGHGFIIIEGRKK